MSEVTAKLEEFVASWRDLQGDEKGEAQVCLDKLFRAFGHAGYKEAGATLEYRVKQARGTTKFADLVWRPRWLRPRPRARGARGGGAEAGGGRPSATGLSLRAQAHLPRFKRLSKQVLEVPPA